MHETSPVLLGIIASLFAGLATCVGAIPVFFTRNIPRKAQDGMLGFAAGVMLAATIFSLIIPSIDKAGGGLQGVMVAAVGIMAGGIFLDLVDKISPHEHFIKGPEGGTASSSLAKIWLFVIAITIHNFPEGLAVGVGVGSGDLGNGISLAIGIALQNIPEGLAVALALLGENYRPGYVFWIVLLTGLVEPVGAMFGLLGAVFASSALPYALAFAGGAMLFVISDEIIPETHERGNERIATYLILIGFIVMMALD
ncbi:MAG TPA: ZIP family metal transporter, partial [Symbiobacteriaceae bacterium]|nr:ZIP family metal transporter [Symbiobacteriaceae bacterium]